MVRLEAWRSHRRRLGVLTAVLVAVPVAALALGARRAAADFDHDSYRPATLAGVPKEHGDHIDEALANEQHIAIEAAVIKYRLLVVYQGERRKLGAASGGLIDDWGRSLQAVPRNYLALFTQEILVEADDQQYWMPVQAQLVPYVDTELVAGDPIYVYVVFIGVGSRTPVFLVNEFQKARVQ